MNKNLNGVRKRLTPYTPFAVAFTLISLGVTAWSITGIIPSLKGAIAVAFLAEGAWIIFQIAEYRGDQIQLGKHVRLIHLSFAMLILASGANVWHGVDAKELLLAILGGAAPLVAKIAWELDRTSRVDPTAPTAEDRAKSNAKIRETRTKLLEGQAARRIKSFEQEDLLQGIDDDAELDLRALDKGELVAEKRAEIAARARRRAFAVGDFSALEQNVTVERVDEKKKIEEPREEQKVSLEAVPAKTAAKRNVVTLHVGSELPRNVVAALWYME
jgi:hypothetical protein